jgi:hypothetical protein
MDGRAAGVEDECREHTRRPDSPIVSRAGSHAPGSHLPGVEPALGGPTRRRAGGDLRKRRAGASAGCAAAGQTGLDRGAHDTATAVDAGRGSVSGAEGARGGAPVARQPLPWLDDVPEAGGIERGEGPRGRSRCPTRTSTAIAARAGDSLAAAQRAQRTTRDRSRAGCTPVARPGSRPGRVTARPSRLIRCGGAQPLRVHP